MATSKHVFGLALAKMGAKGSSGNMGTVLAAVGETVSASAQMTTDENQVTDFNIEESDSPIEAIVTKAGAIKYSWSSYDVSAYQLFRFFGGVYTPYKSIATVGSVTGGSGYTGAGTYYDVPLTGGTGKGARATVVVAGGVVTTVTITEGGDGYTVADALSASNANIGGAGTGFSVPVATLANSSATQTTWEAPDSFPDLEQSVELLDKKGNKIQIPRAKITGKFGMSFAKDKLGQVDLVATVLQPDDPATKRLKIIYAV
jgi:hypothetical protein